LNFGITVATFIRSDIGAEDGVLEDTIAGQGRFLPSYYWRSTVVPGFVIRRWHFVITVDGDIIADIKKSGQGGVFQRDGLGAGMGNALCSGTEGADDLSGFVAFR
jgi:hypothetical protein